VSPLSEKIWQSKQAGPFMAALVSLIAIIISIDAAGEYPATYAGPGITIDESFNVQQGVRLIEGLKGILVGSLTMREVFGDVDDLSPEQAQRFGYHLPDHPPLGRIWLGCWHHIAWGCIPPYQSVSFFSTDCARSGSAVAFALLVYLIGSTSTYCSGRLAGVVAAASVVLMPRVFGHAHLASLETVTTLSYAGVILYVACYWNHDHPPKHKTALITGLLWGLALLTKIQAILLPVPIVFWALLHWRHKAILPLIICGVTGFALFFIGWPWLWLDPITHLQNYFGSTTNRVMLHVYYFGTVYQDKQTPWHYPFVMTLLTIPIGLLALFLYRMLLGGADKVWMNPRSQLLLGSIAFPLCLFAVPGVAVYDGVRLFVMVFPLLAIFVGEAVQLLWQRYAQKWNQILLAALLTLLMLTQSAGLLLYAPCWFSYYNLLIGGLPGARRVGLETTYWGESLTRDLLTEITERVPAGSVLVVAPVLHQFQLNDVLTQSPILRGHQIQLASQQQAPLEQARYLLVFDRRADLSPHLQALVQDAEILAETRRLGVPLARLYRIR